MKTNCKLIVGDLELEARVIACRLIEGGLVELTIIYRTRILTASGIKPGSQLAKIIVDRKKVKDIVGGFIDGRS